MSDLIKRNDIKHDAISDKFVKQSFAEKKPINQILSFSVVLSRQQTQTLTKITFIKVEFSFTLFLLHTSMCAFVKYFSTQTNPLVCFEFNYDAS